MYARKDGRKDTEKELHEQIAGSILFPCFWHEAFSKMASGYLFWGGK